VFQQDRDQLATTLVDMEAKHIEVTSTIQMLQDGLSEQTKADSVTSVVVWLGETLRLIQRSVLIQARARLEAVTVEDIDLDAPEAFDIALANRLDIMNARAALVDRWRQIEISADALQSTVNITASGDIRTARNNPVSFRAPTGSLRMGMEFDAPFTRLLERNTYRESLINYQQNRRTFIQSRDSVHLGLRNLLRQIDQLRTNMEIQRQAAAISIRRVDLTRATLYAPVAPPQPGQPVAPFGPSSSRNLIDSLDSLRNTQSAFMSAWLSYYAARMRLARELGIMTLDQDGIWMDEPTPVSSENTSPSEDGPADQESPAIPMPMSN
jgi:outer membrane protein TolC